MTVCISAYSQASGLADLKFGKMQIADSQWNVSACMYTTTCQIYSKNPGTAYKIPWTSGQLSWAAGDYVAFVKTGNTANPWQAIQYNSNGAQKAIMGAGHIINMGPDFFFFVGSDNNTGQLFSMTQGFSSTSGVTWTGTLNPTVSQVDTYATGGSTTPLAAGQTYVAPSSGPTYPSYVTVGSGTPGTMDFGSSTAITSQQQTNIGSWSSRTIADGNQIYIVQANGNNNVVTMDQNGNKNLIRSVIAGTNNNITANQGVPGIGQNEMKINFEGNNNVVKVNQSRDMLGNPLGTNGHYLDVELSGWGTNLMIQQSNTGGVGGHYNETTINGNGNNVIEKQTDNGNKIMFVKIDGALNTLDVTQRGTGQHKLDATLTGDRNSATVLQEGSTANNATLNLTNLGGPATVNVQQNGGQSVGVSISCATAGGCAPVTIRQGY